MHVLRDWDQALNFERRGGFNAFDLSDKLEHIEMNSRRWKRILGQSTRRIRDAPTKFFRVTPPSLFAPGQSCVAACSWS